MKNSKHLLLALALFISSTFAAFAQLQTPAASPAAFVSQVVGFTKISIDYSSPAVKGRKIFGEIEKYGVTWRAGANAQTIIEFSTPVSVGGKNLRAGKYSIFMTPAASGEWTVHLNSKAASVFAYMKEGAIDEEAVAADNAVSFKVAPSAGNTERLQYHISAENNKVAKVTMAWEKVVISFMVDTQVDQKMEGFKSAF
ncbi:Protein of unknown function [Algoriphagus alkaliphilus]|uniref:DUF2911 domain-containing protein n=1 Tax=Algoriphagus alkaliphilus TaxID=279824 RepID=A0A1G5VKB4_9BACT|nr:DUF2911 domain-containing protein [Algoriphagus alkaliphilus]MBA4299793.1 DUF2911 domain-containing protein [Cyclobacterium sp.]SDA46292.1 Protein of unknown function [Algoriphagus alkaliphilus]